MTYVFIVTLLVFVVTGALPALLGHYALGVRFLGGPWLASLLGVIGAALGSTIDTLFLPMIPDLLSIGGAADLVPPLVGSILIVTAYGLISSSNLDRRSEQ